MRWYLLHEGATVFKEDEQWYLLVHTTCKHLQAATIAAAFMTPGRRSAANIRPTTANTRTTGFTNNISKRPSRPGICRSSAWPPTAADCDAQLPPCRDLPPILLNRAAPLPRLTRSLARLASDRIARIEPRTLKGFRDYLPEAMIPREWLIDTAKRVYRSYGFSPIDTPALEYLEILTGKGSDEPTSSSTASAITAAAASACGSI